ncbi:LytTR family DNA-binding domain-containing protein [Eremococcus coleocola]|uniref:LytTR family DNA-binding domain-containing protein n=1 Tax=Eremococcus coleocola TaxID=88132 RepID=UPI000413C5D9|nr:LytTR family DNA-binding domain-containing protein [Eremococcus coleocola]
MQVKLELSPKYSETFAVIYAAQMDSEIESALSTLGQGKPKPILGLKEDRQVVLTADQVYMARVEGGKVMIYSQDQVFQSRYRLYELLELLGPDFQQISKQTLVNLDRIREIEAGFSGSLFLKLNNGQGDYVSRKFLPELKKYFGI